VPLGKLNLLGGVCKCLTHRGAFLMVLTIELMC
jgi:hypothetical protein